MVGGAKIFKMQEQEQLLCRFWRSTRTREDYTSGGDILSLKKPLIENFVSQTFLPVCSVQSRYAVSYVFRLRHIIW